MVLFRWNELISNLAEKIQATMNRLRSVTAGLLFCEFLDLLPAFGIGSDDCDDECHLVEQCIHDQAVLRAFHRVVVLTVVRRFDFL